MIMLTIALIIISATPIYAGKIDYSEESKQLGREAGLEFDVDWEEINRRQNERRNRIEAKKNPATAKGYVKTVSGQSRSYGSKNSYDEFHTAPKDIPANDNYSQDVWHPEDRGMRINGFDEFHFSDEL